MNNFMLLSAQVAEELSSEASVFFGSAENIIESLKIMGLGMLGIFIVTAVIIAMVTLLNITTSGMKKKKKDEDK